MRDLTIVMYHYVRDVGRTKYPGIRALSVGEFEGQLDYLERHYAFVDVGDVLAALDGEGEALPPNGVLLTFDDGYRDHYDTVLPRLRERGIGGIFFPPAAPVIRRKVLDVNKIQFVLSRVPDVTPLVDAINGMIRDNRARLGLDAPETYWARYAKPSRFDGAEVVFVKRMMQHALPLELRAELVAAWFADFVTADEQTFADELYLSTSQLRAMVGDGMHVGSHGDNHHWMDRLDADQQRAEIAASLKFLNTLGVPDRDWIMCYPYGASDDGLVRMIAELGCVMGVTTVPAVARLGTDHRLCLPRLDTNDLPKAPAETAEAARRAPS